MTMTATTVSRLRRACAALLLLAPGIASAHFVNFTASLDGDQVNPPTGSAALGSATGIFDTHTNEFTWTLVVAGLTSDVTRVHFHGNTDAPPNHADDNRGIVLGFIDLVNPALVDSDIDVLLDTLTGDTNGTFVGAVDLDEVPGALANLGGLLGSRWYINIHNEAFPGGEIRGQFFEARPVPLPAAAALMPAALGLLVAAGRRRAARRQRGGATTNEA